MKKQLLALAVLTAGIANAQTWSENFNSTTPPTLPATWAQNNVDGLTPSTTAGIASYSFGINAWVTKNVSTSTDPITAAHGKIVASTSYYTPAGISNDWLITPSFTVPTNGVITWEGYAPDANFQDGYLVKISTTGTTTANFSTTLLTVAAENSTWTARSINLSAYAGQTVYIAFINNSNDMNLLWLDNIQVLVPASNDIVLSSVSPTSQASWGANGSNKIISGTVTNNGYNNITSFTAKYTAGGAPVSQVFSGLNLAYAQTYNFSFTTPYTITSTSEVAVKIWADLTGDAIHTNDTLNTLIKGYSFVPNHRVVFEEGTGTWCGWCVRGAVYMDSMYIVNPTTTALIAVHNSSSDPMTNTIYDAGMGTLISGYPTSLCDRSVDIIDPGDMFTSYANHINDFGVADITLTPTYNTTTRVANVVVNTHISGGFLNNSANNDYRLAVVFTEMGVTGTASGYGQHNYYSSASQNLPLVGAGHNWQTEPAIVPPTSMKYDFVARTILGGFTGQANSLPATLVAGATYTSSVFSYTVPAAYNAGNMRVHALLIDAKNQIIYNANTTTLTASTAGINEVTPEKIEMAIYPNPAKNNATIELNLMKSETVTVNVLSIMGQVVYTQTYTNLPMGKQTIILNSENWSNGIYNVNISSSNGNVSRKLEIIK
jgi:hypothetical protein